MPFSDFDPFTQGSLYRPEIPFVVEEEPRMQLTPSPPFMYQPSHDADLDSVEQIQTMHLSPILEETPVSHSHSEPIDSMDGRYNFHPLWL